MHPRIKEVLDHLDASRRALRDAVDSVPSEDRKTQPEPTSWSVVGVLEHLAIVENGVANVLKLRIAEGRAAGVGAETETTPVVNPRHDAKVRDRGQRIEAPLGAQPKDMPDPETAWRALETANDALRAVVLDADGMALCEITQPHRVFGVLNVYQWISFIGSHEFRHAAQIREIGAALRKSRG